MVSKFRNWWVFGLTSLMLVALTSGALAQNTDLEISRLINRGQFAAALQVLTESSPSQTDTLFFQARIDKARGQYSAAIVKLNEVLRRSPNHLNAKRELAHTLLLSARFNAAATQFRALLDVDQNPTMRAGYVQFLTTIENTKPVGFSGFVTLKPTSNLNNGTQNTRFDTFLGQVVIDESSRAVSGVGLQAGISGYFRYPVGQGNRMVLDWSASGTRYKNAAFNSDATNISLQFEHPFRTGQIQLGPYWRRGFRSGDISQDTSGFALNTDIRLSQDYSLNANFTTEYRLHPTKPHLDGTLDAGRVTIKRVVSDSLSVSGGISASTSRPESAHLQYDSLGVNVAVAKTWQSGIRTSVGLNIGTREFVGPYPLTFTPRADSFFSVNLSVQDPAISYAGFSPKVGCSYTQNRSNVAFFDYDTTACQLSFTRSF